VENEGLGCAAIEAGNIRAATRAFVCTNRLRQEQLSRTLR
jgi:hypothetical protein